MGGYAAYISPEPHITESRKVTPLNSRYGQTDRIYFHVTFTTVTHDDRLRKQNWYAGTR